MTDPHTAQGGKEPVAITGAEVADLIGPTLDKFVTGAAPYVRSVADEIYEQLLNGVQDYLRSNAEWNIGAEIDRCRAIEADNRRLREAAKQVLDRMSSTYKARNGREVGVQGDDGEKCWIVHSDDIEALRAAISRATHRAPIDQGGE